MRAVLLIMCLGVALPMAAEEAAPSWAEVREGRARALAKIETLYMVYGARRATLEQEGEETWLVDTYTVVELWMDGAKIRQRRHSVTRAKLNPRSDGSSEPYRSEEANPITMRGSNRMPESVALQDELYAAPLGLMSVGKGEGPPPRPMVYKGDEAQAFGENLAKENIVAAAFDYYLPDESDAATGVFDQRKEGWPVHELVRRDGMLLMTFRDVQPEPRLRGYRFIDPNRGFLEIAGEYGRLLYTQTPFEGRGHYGGDHTIPFEAAPGIWLPHEMMRRYVDGRQRYIHHILVLECRVNEPIDPAVFDPASVGVGEFAGPEGSPIPGERRYTVPTVTLAEVSGDAERLARRDGGQPTVFDYPIRIDDDLPAAFPPPPAPEVEREPAPEASAASFDIDSALRWLVVFVTAAVLVVVIGIRLRSA